STIAMKVRFLSKSGTSAAELALSEDRVLLHGEPLDDRGQLACACTPEAARVRLVYGVDDMSLTVGTKTMSSDLASELLHDFDRDKVVLEATTLGFAELFCAT